VRPLFPNGLAPLAWPVLKDSRQSPTIKARYLVAPIIALVVINYLGAAFVPTLAPDYPLLLIAMNPRNAHLILVANNIAFWAFVLVGSMRLLISDPLFYLLGYEHGDAGKRWIDRQVQGSGRIIAALERWFPRISWLLVFAAPNNIVSLLAGITRMRFAVFAALNIAGTLTRLLLIWWFADLVQDQLNWILDIFTRYRWQLTAITIAVVGLQVIMSVRGDKGDVHDLIELEHEIEDEEPNDSVQ